MRDDRHGIVVDVDAEHHRRTELGGDGVELVHQRRLAPVAAIGVVREVALVVQFFGRCRPPGDALPVSEGSAVRELAFGEGGRVGGDQHHP